MPSSVIFSIFSISISAYTVGCKGIKGLPKQAEKIGIGSSIPISVPPSFEVYPEIKWYAAWFGESLEKINSEIVQEIKDAAQYAIDSPFPDEKELFTNVYL